MTSAGAAGLSARSGPAPHRPARWRLAALALAAGLAAAAPTGAQDRVLRGSAQVRAGETRQLGVWGGHGRDCVTSTQPNAIQVAQAPRLGTLSQRVGAPYTAQNSLSGTCEGSRFIGTAVDYTARAAGADTVALDVVFNNGVAHWIFAVTVLP